MSFTLYIPATLGEAVAIENAKFLAGGTVLLVRAHKGFDIGQNLVSLERLAELRGIVLEADTLVIGACTTFDDIERSQLVKTHAYALWQAAREVGGPQIRNRATLGGNLASGSPASDGATPLLALDAVLSLTGRCGTRSMPLREFFKGKGVTALEPGELITAIRVRLGAESRFIKVGKRSALAVATLNIAIARRDGIVSVAAGAVAPAPLYCVKTSDAINNGAENPADVMLTEISPISDRWGDAEYKRRVCVNLLNELITEMKV